MTLHFPHAMVMNLGESSKGHGPKTRMGTAALLRKALQEARQYAEQRQRAADKEEPFDRDLKLEQLALVTSGEIPALVNAQRADDILTALRISNEFALTPIIGMAAEGYLVQPQLQAAKVPMILHPTMQRLDSLETFHSAFTNAAHLSNAGIPLAITSGYEGYVPKSRVIRHEAALAMTFGLGHARALSSVTLDAAKLLGIDAEFGSLEPGKRADVVLYDGDPFEHTTHVTHVFVDGKLVYQRSKRQRIPIARRNTFSAPEVPCCVWW